ncbi:ComGF family competence protein [Pediococcus claussenii]|uniref:Uncharacterized protein n=2 Tax=Pediococcus claussenii TaxID=187452 RepID=G8PCQ7_PEDCP|nr:ComGF family competence protein [Pediococcus claussenii]AEV95042.1 hypothetical protein PECL_751 [Pediococcus claussenii ATCC BAA-344]KRN19156.1 hypothetical protein IV79_GL001528 [Pediococcus claussenii]
MFLIIHPLVNSTHRYLERDDSIDLVVLINELESERHSFTLKNCKRDSLVLFSGKENKDYILSSYKKMLRFTPGHMPLLLGVNSCWFEKEGKFIKIHLNHNGHNYNGKVYLNDYDKKSK